MSVIKFYSEKDEYGFLSNFYTHDITINEKTYSTVEHYFQSRKYNYTYCSEECLKYSEVIRFSSDPYTAKFLAEDSTKKLKIDPEWDILYNENTNLKKKDLVMLSALYEKFKDPELNKLLMGTENKMLVENSTDSYWGCGDDGSGKNMLGLLLMSVRQEYT